MDPPNGFHPERIENLRRELDMMKLTNRARKVFIIVADFLAGRHQILDGLSHDLAVDVLAVVELRKKVISDRIESLMVASQAEAPAPAMANPPPILLPAAEPPAATVAGGVSVSVPVAMDGGEPRHGSYLLEKVAAILTNENGGVEPSEADINRYLREVVLH